MWLINWLVGRASNVYQWFGSSYRGAYSKLQSFFTWLNTYALKAKKWAVDELFPAILRHYYKARDYVYSKYLEAIAWADKVKATVLNWINTQIIKVKQLLGIKVSELSAEDQRLFNKIKFGDEETETGLRAWVNTFLNNLLRPFKWILVYRDLLEGLKELFTEENLKKLISLLTTLFSSIFTFATRPLDTILSIIQPILLELLNFSIAYALGTEKYDLPDWPDWSVFGIGGDGGGLPSGVKQDLSAPLSSLRISGYTFRDHASHMGIDLAVYRGQNIYAMHSGTIEYVNRAFSGYGHQITLGGGFWWTRYAHLLTILVSRGQHVKKGQLIGKGDNTGNSTGDHLHLEIKYKGSFIDPAHVLF